MTAIQLLRKTRELIGKGKWIKGTAFRDKFGRFSVVQTAEMFCLYGGMRKVLHLDTGKHVSRLISIAGDALNNTEAVIDEGRRGKVGYYIGWNDDPWRTKDEVLTALDQAVELLETNKVQ